MRSAPLIAMTTAIAGLAILISVSVRYMDFFDIDSVRVVGMDSIPASVEAMLSSCYGVNRFALDEKALEERIEANPLVDSCVLSYDWPARLVVALVRSPQDVLVSDGEGLYLMESGEVQEVAVEDLPADRKDLCTVEVSKAFMDYMKRYGAPSSFLDILDLVAEVSQEYSWLITRMKYDNNTADGFGQLVLGLDPLHSELYVREPVSRQRISDSIRVIGQSMEEDPAGKIDFQTTHWDLYSKALVRRTVE